MGKYLKLFNEMSQYETFKGSEEYILPNVSYVENSTDVLFNPSVKPASPNVVCTYNVTDISQETPILHPYGLPYMAYMIVDGVEMDVDGYYQFDTIGNHVVEFVLDDPTTIGNNGTFMNCSGLTSVIIPDSVNNIGYSAFRSCSGLTSVVIPYGVTEIGGYAFDSCSGLISITIPDSVNSIGRDAFYHCESLTSVTIPDSVTTIGITAFCGCTGLSEVTIGTGVTTINNYTFENCISLTSVNIPDSVTSIGHDVFNSCTNLNEITCLATTAPNITYSTFQEVNENGILKVPAGSDYSSWMNTDGFYLGYYNWTIEYI